MKSLLFLFFFLPCIVLAQAKVDTNEVYSTVMKKNLKVAVTTPDSYGKGNQKYPTLYLLH